MAALEAMQLVKSVVYEVFRIELSVSLLYGRAKGDFVIESYDNAFSMKKREMLFETHTFI